jgi:hypothetical protein
MRCPFCGKPVELGEPFVLHECEPHISALEYAGPGFRRAKYAARYGWRLHRGDLVIGSLTLGQVLELIEAGYTAKGADSDDANAAEVLPGA